MPTVHFTSQLRDQAPGQPIQVAGDTVRVALEAALQDRDRLKSYVFDEQGRLRKHVAVFVDGSLIVDRVGLGDRVQGESEIYVMQALSGG